MNFEDRESFHFWFMIAAISGTPITEKMQSKPPVITMQLNGEEIDPVQALSRLKEEFDRQVNEKALLLLEQAKETFFEPLEEKMEQVREKFEDSFEDILKTIDKQ